MGCAETGRQLEVLALDVDHADRVRPGQEVRHHHAHALAAARRRTQQHGLLAGERQEPVLVLAEDDPAVVAQLRLLDLHAIRKPCRAVQLAPLRAEAGHGHWQEEEQQRCRQPYRDVELLALREIDCSLFPILLRRGGRQVRGALLVEQLVERGAGVGRSERRGANVGHDADADRPLFRVHELLIRHAGAAGPEGRSGCR